MLNPYRYNIPTLKLKYSKRNGKCEWTLKIFRVLRLQAVKGLRFPSLIPPDWDVIAFLDICSPQFPFLPILLPFLLLPSWEICLVTALRHFLVCQAAGCLYWIISQSKSRARGALGAGSGHIKTWLPPASKVQMDRPAAWRAGRLLYKERPSLTRQNYTVGDIMILTHKSLPWDECHDVISHRGCHDSWQFYFFQNIL